MSIKEALFESKTDQWYGFGFGLGTLSLPSVSSDCVFFLASDLEPCLVMGAMSEGFWVDVME